MSIKNPYLMTKKLKNSFESVCFLMTLLFSLLPVYAIFAPDHHGIIFTFISKIVIAVFAVCIAVYLYYFFALPDRGDKSKFASLRQNVASYFSRNKHAALLLVVYIFTVVSVFLAPNRERALAGTEFRPDGLLMHTALAALFVFSSFIKDNGHKKIIYGAYIAGFVFVSLIMVQQYYGIIGTAGQEECGAIGEALRQQYLEMNVYVGHFFKGTTGSFYNLNHMGYYVCMCSMLCAGAFIKSTKKSTMIFSAILMAYSYWVLIINNTFGAYLAVFAVLVVMSIVLFFRNKTKFVTAFTPLIVFVLVSAAVVFTSSSESIIIKNITTLGSDIVEIAGGDNSSDSGAESSSEDQNESGASEAGSGRWGLWKMTLDMIGEKPVFGYGPDNLADEYKGRGAKLDRAHCEPLERAVSTGILSALCYVGAIVYVIWTRLMKKDHVSTGNVSVMALLAVFGYSISALVGVLLFYTACHYIIFMGFLSE